VIASKLGSLCDEVMENTRQPEFRTIRGRMARRRLRRRTGTGVAAAVLVLAGGLVWGSWPGSPASSDVNPASRSTAAADRVQFADAADATHLYALLNDCTGCGLIGSDDGGRTWTTRLSGVSGTVRIPGFTEYEFGDLAVRGPSILEMNGSVPKSGRPSIDVVSTDGGRTWAKVTADQNPVAAVPAGSWLEIVSAVAGEPGALWVIDPATHTSHPLATSPAGMHVVAVARTSDRAGLWVQGRDITDSKAMIAVSKDRGATWITRTFDLTDPGLHPSTASPDPSSTTDTTSPRGTVPWPSVDVVTYDGTTAYAVVGVQTDWSLRSTDGGRTWNVMNGGNPLPGPLAEVGAPAPGLMDPRPSFVRPDGTHVLQTEQDDQYRAYASTDGGSRYAQIDPDGWPQGAVQITPAGTYIARSWRAIYLSTDGKSWTTVIP
jgi:hypothetical protein